MLAPLALLSALGCAPTTAALPVANGTKGGLPPATTEPQLTVDDGRRVDETGDETLVDLSGSGPLQKALSKYREGAHEAAAVQLHAVAGDSGGDERTVQAAQFFLAKALCHAGYLNACQLAFEAVTRGPTHRFRRRALPWLAWLARRLPEPSGVTEQVGRFSAVDITEATDAQDQALLRYQLSRWHQQRGALEAAILHARAVPSETRWGANARLLEGITHTMSSHADDAAAAFRSARQSAETQLSGARAQPDRAELGRLRDLAWMSEARLFYSAATTPGHTNGRALVRALEAWDKVDGNSSFYPDATFEQVWALYLLEKHDYGLDKLAKLPTWYRRVNLEAQVLEALLLSGSCQLARARAVTDQLGKQAAAAIGFIDRFLESHDPEAIVNAARRIRHKRDAQGDGVEPFLAHAVSSRDYRRRFAGLKRIDEELAALATAATAAELGSSPLLVDLEEVLELAKATRSLELGTRIGKRLRKMATEYREHQVTAADIAERLAVPTATNCDPATS